MGYEIGMWPFKLRNAFLFWLFNGLFYMLSGQAPFYRNYTTADGLPSDNVYSVVQDDMGFIWFSTDNGVSRFDGTRFKNFSIAEGIGDNDVLRTLKDSKGRLWFQTFNGKVSYYQDGKIFNATNDTVLHNLQFNSAITYAFEDSKQDIWISSNDRQLDEIKPSGKIEIIKGVTMLYGWEDNQHQVKILASRELLTIKNGKVDSAKDEQYLNCRTGILLPGDKSLLIPIKDDVAICDLDGKILKRRPVQAFSPSSHQNVSIDRNGNIWFSTLSGAIEIDSGRIFLEQGHRFFENNSITWVYEDRENNLWFSSYGNGVFMIPSLYMHIFDTKTGLVENNITAVTVLNNGSWVVGSHNGSVQIITHDSLTPKHRSLIPPSGIVLKIKNDAKGNVYIMTNINIYNYKNGLFSRVKDSISWYKSIFIASDGTPWIGRGTGIAKIAKNEVVDDYRTKIVNRIYAFTEIGSGDFLVGTDKGLYHYKNQQLKEERRGNPLLGHRITNFAVTADSSLWMATNDIGLLRLKGDSVSAFGVREHLASNNCISLLAEGNTVYIGTDKGLCSASIIHDSVKIISCLLNGITGTRINQVVKTDKNTFLLATGRGLIEFDDRYLPQAPLSIPYLNAVYINEIDRPLSGLNELHYNENNIQFQFGVINFNPFGKAVFCYKLEGVDSGWNFTTSTSVKYAQLRQGNYKFIISTEDPGGNRNLRSASLSFFIATPWWETWWFILLVVASGITIMVYLAKARIEVYKRKVEQERAFAESELKALRAQINPHFIYNSLNSIQDFVLMNQKEEANLYLSKFATLIRGILANSRKPNISLAEEIASLKLYLELEALRFNDRFTYQFVVDEHLQADEVQIPSMILQPYIENAVLHGLSSIEKGGKIVVGFHREGNLLRCTIEDNGIGRKKSEEIRQKRLWKSDPSLGMKITEERIDILSASYKEKITLQITDLVDGRNNATGTRVSIYLPFNWTEPERL